MSFSRPVQPIANLPEQAYIPSTVKTLYLYTEQVPNSQQKSKLSPKAITYCIAKPSIEHRYKAWQWSQILYITCEASYTSTKDTQAQISYIALQIYTITYGAQFRWQR